MLFTAADGLFKLNGQSFFPRFGTIPYSQIEPERWPILLESFKKSGLNGVSAVIPWLSSRNLIAFIEACQAASLPLVLNPGPFGQAPLLPWWHPLERAQVVRWYESLGSILKRYQFDPVVALQIDCPATIPAMPNYHDIIASGAGDRNAWTHENGGHGGHVRVRSFLEHKYGTLEALNQAWESSWQDWTEIHPLTPPIRHCALHDWQEFIEQERSELLGWLIDLAKQTLLPVPLIIGHDLTAKYSDTPYASDLPFGAALASDFAANGLESPACPGRYTKSPLICATRLDCNGLYEHSNITADTVVQSAISAIAHGSKGFSYWGFAVSDPIPDESHGENDLGATWGSIKSVAEFISQYEKDLLSTSEVWDDIAILLYESNQRLFPEDFLFRRYPGPGIPDPTSFIRRTGLYGIYALLTASGFRPRLINLENADGHELQRCQVLFFPNLGYIDSDSYDKLARYVEAGGNLVTLPMHPKYDLSGKPLDTSALYAAPEKDQTSAGRAGLLAAWTWHLARRRLFKPKSGSQPQLEAERALELSRNDFLLKTHLPAMPMVDTAGRYIRGDIQHTVFAPREDARVLLLNASPSAEILGYAMPLGQGVSTVLGTVIGGSLMLPHYYRLSETELRTLCDLCKDLLAEWGLTPRTKSELPVEVIYRTTSRHTYVFLINRGRARAGRFELARELCPGAPEVIFSWGGSEAEPVLLGQIQANLAQDGIVVLRYCR